MIVRTSILIISIFFSIQAIAAQDRSINPKDYQGNPSLDLIGKEFTAKRDNLYKIEKKQIAYFDGGNTLSGVKVFLKVPDGETCTRALCDRFELLSDKSFKIEDIVHPREKENKEFTCQQYLTFCYAKLRFDDGKLAYMKLTQFTNALSPVHAEVFDIPYFLQIIPKLKSQEWNKAYASYLKHFNKQGVAEGYTQENVLISQWGKPMTKSRTLSDGDLIEVWVYNAGTLGFLNGHVVSITNIE